MTVNSTDFAQLVTGFLTEYLPLQRNYSRNTVLSYKDALKLFAVFLTEFKNIRLTEVQFALIYISAVTLMKKIIGSLIKNNKIKEEILWYF